MNDKDIYFACVVSVVIPSFKVVNHILQVIDNIGPEISRIYVVDDFCPDGSGDYVEQHCKDNRVVVLRNSANLGVGGAVMVGYAAALDDGADIIVKIDGDGQMDPALIPVLVAPVISGESDYSKGNRFFRLESVRAMPKIRLFGNAILSLLSKLSTGYWNIFDPTNGFTAIHSKVARLLPFDKISKRFFFETDMLFRLSTLRAVVIDVPMNSIYGSEVSNLVISKVVLDFFIKHLRNFIKRIFYNYYLRDMSIASLELPLGLILVIIGFIFGVIRWIDSAQTMVLAPAGTVMLSALPVILGFQLILAFFAYDIASVPKRPVHRLLFAPHKKRNESGQNKTQVSDFR